MKRSAEDIVKTYLGERTGKQVLAGRTMRGEGEKIHAVIWLCDLRDSTRLSDSSLWVERGQHRRHRQGDRAQAGSHRFPGDPSHAFAPVQASAPFPPLNNDTALSRPRMPEWMDKEIGDRVADQEEQEEIAAGFE